jgi:hypothetical protein
MSSAALFAASRSLGPGDSLRSAAGLDAGGSRGPRSGLAAGHDVGEVLSVSGSPQSYAVSALAGNAAYAGALFLSVCPRYTSFCHRRAVFLSSRTCLFPAFLCVCGFRLRMAADGSSCAVALSGRLTDMHSRGVTSVTGGVWACFQATYQGNAGTEASARRKLCCGCVRGSGKRASGKTAASRDAERGVTDDAVNDSS